MQESITVLVKDLERANVPCTYVTSKMYILFNIRLLCRLLKHAARNNKIYTVYTTVELKFDWLCQMMNTYGAIPEN